MALVLKDRVKETTTTTGTGTLTLLGASAGYQSFSAIGNANTCYYAISSTGGSQWEVGIGTYTTSGTTLSRDTILESSTGGTAVSLSAGTKDVYVVYPAEKSVWLNAADNVGIGAEATAGYKLDVAGNFKVLGAIDENVYAVVDAAGVPLSPSNGTIQTWTLGASRTPTAGTWNAGESMTMMINDGTAFTVTWTSLPVTWVGGIAPTLATTGFTVIEFWKVSTTIYGALVGSVA